MAVEADASRAERVRVQIGHWALSSPISSSPKGIARVGRWPGRGGGSTGGEARQQRYLRSGNGRQPVGWIDRGGKVLGREG